MGLLLLPARIGLRRHLASPALLLAIALLSACDQDTADSNHGADAVHSAATAKRQTGDLDAIAARGELRILIVRGQEQHRFLPRTGSPVAEEIEALRRFAASKQLKPRVIAVEQFRELIPGLLDGRGDVIAANLTVTDKRREQLAFSYPLHRVREQLVTRIDGAGIKKEADLAGREIAVRPGTSFWDTVSALVERVPNLKRQELPGNLSNDALLDRLASGKIDLLVMDSNAVTNALQYRDDVRVLRDLTDARPIAWALRQDSPALLDALNRFISSERLNDDLRETWTGDLDGIRDRRVLRVAIQNGPGGYYLQRGELAGFHYELAKSLAKKLKLRLRVIAGNSQEDLVARVLNGEADVAAGFFTPDQLPENAATAGPVFRLQPHMLTQQRDRLPADITGLSDTLVFAEPDSEQWQLLEERLQPTQNTSLYALAPNADQEQILEAIRNGSMPYVASADLSLRQLLNPQGGMIRAFPIGTQVGYGWLTRNTSPQLTDAVAAHFKKYYRSTGYNLTVRRYLRGQRPFYAGSVDGLPIGQLSPYDSMVQAAADEHGFDWRLIVAQMYQESQFDPKARSRAGARGLMQLVKSTAKQMRVTDRDDPYQSINGGVGYLNWLYNRFEDDLHVTERLWFALASYNAGLGHVKDARRLARQKGWDDDRWFGHVEKAIRLLSQQKYARKARYGYVRGGETARYVREIRERFHAYRQIQELSGHLTTAAQP